MEKRGLNLNYIATHKNLSEKQIITKESKAAEAKKPA